MAHALGSPAQVWLWLAGGALIAAMVPTGLLLAVDTRTIDGVNVWVKPLKFEVSFAVHLLTVAWLMGCLPEAEAKQPAMRAIAATLVAIAFLEVAYIAHQAARAEGSHFNLSTPFTRLMYGLMGIGAVTALAVTAMVGAAILRYGDTTNTFVVAAGVGLILGSLLGGVTGAYLGAQPGHSVGVVGAGGPAIPIFGWSRAVGDLRVAHFIGLHVMQVLPLTALAAAAVLPAAFGLPLVTIVALAGTLATGATFFQAKAGLPLLP